MPIMYDFNFESKCEDPPAIANCALVEKNVLSFVLIVTLFVCRDQIVLNVKHRKKKPVSIFTAAANPFHSCSVFIMA